MTLPSRFSEEDVESLVRSVLRREAARVDVDKNYAAIQRRTDPTGGAAAYESSKHVGSRARRRPMTWRRFSIVAGVVLAFGFACWTLYPTQSSAYAILRAAQSEVARGADRCYRAEAELPKTWPGRNGLRGLDWEALVWTRGDRFRATMTRPGRKLVWGKDEKGNVWLVDRPNLGLIFGRGETPPLLAIGRSFLSLDVARLTNRFLKYFELKREKPLPNDGAKVAVVWATAKSDSPRMHFNAARLVVGLDDNVIRRMELYRMDNGIERVNLTLTLIDRGAQPDKSYHLAANLQQGAEVLDFERADDREAAFWRIVQELRKRKGSIN